MKFKNYIILFIVYILTILLVFYLFFLYRNSNDKLDNTFNKIINQVNNDSFDDVIKNIDNYMIEYKEFILYINFDDALNNYELRLNEFIHDNNVSDMFISLRIFDNKLSIVNKILEHYKYNGDFKKRLNKGINKKESCFKQRINGRCIFLNKENLCDMQLSMGEEGLCKICSEYPRHIEEFENVRETTLSVSCPVVAADLLSNKNKE